jgi:hypothetical protein
MALMTSLIGALLALIPRAAFPREAVQKPLLVESLKDENNKLKAQLAELRHDFLVALEDRDALRDEVERLWRPSRPQGAGHDCNCAPARHDALACSLSQYGG